MRVPLAPDALDEALAASGRRWPPVEFHTRLGSTNDRARELATLPDAGWRVVLTDHQVGGRGRLGRVWTVPERASLAVSVVVPLPTPSLAAWAPLVAGLALARAVAEVTTEAGTPVTPRLKWPNDVLVAQDDDRKVSGILCELVAGGANGVDGGGAALVVVGAGVNVDQDRAELPVPTATSLALAGAVVGREPLAARYLLALRALVDELGDHGAAAMRTSYERACVTVGLDVEVHLPSGVVAGRAVGVDEHGGLVVSTPTGRRAFAAGDVVHVRRPGGRLT
ncbi:biotin--[acetyl-CoA-carboxylase] ligase [Terracoccus luteus]|uniref:biotin--[biotin carboxyl-carrier protein] ligase n=1 Tax=Terracoccus luteus TaxID=53356 RepID=A0A839PU17_9MICO|nr:biotin--[acetyl-CoA-carboxylase] ligase [Terracoccus luteus]MBB2985486.1 BirA family biotin operon repressor/biotin-[acetyl-CoA-carboxylase] ligase [Terracoccus luteus]MCP2171138.1 BirA family biotin operon repressor/biotin-[acetyl-CoA-carboxylase] ligase [Terracoccus luteus]